jgi:hypothetical protein
MTKIYFYAPNSTSYQLLQHNYHHWVGTHSNFVAWAAPTYFHLKEAGFDCSITQEIPDEGILFVDRDLLGDQHKYLGKTMLICAKSDREYHPSAHIHILHNINDASNKLNQLWNPYYIPHWPLPGLILRRQERGSLVENIGYIGTRSQLAAELKSPQWSEALEKIGCRWLPIFEPSQWHDYQEIDVVVAARSFGQQIYLNKGAIKLFNCWRAGVPAIFAPESAFLAEKNSDLDFIIANSLQDAIAAVDKLKNAPELYQAMIANGWRRAQTLTTEDTLGHWINFFQEYAFPEYEKWCQLSDTQRKALFVRRWLRLKQMRLRQRGEKLINKLIANSNVSSG